MENTVAHLAVKLMLGFLALVLVLFVLAAAALVAASPGKVRPIRGEDGKPLPDSISEKLFLTVNGAKQGLFLKGKNRKAPILLYLHGGMPDYFLSERYPTGLEDLFLVAWWEQRGSGISFDPASSDRAITLDLMVDDTLAVADYLRSRFGVDKVYLMAHSGGSYIGITAAARAPEKFAAYIAVAQIVDTRESEALAYDCMLDAYRAAGNDRMVRKLERFPVSIEGGIPAGYLMLRDVAMHDLGVGTMRSMRSIVKGLLLPSLAFPEYTVGEKYRFWAAKARSGIASLFTRMMDDDLRKRIGRLEIPAYFLHGSFDRTCSYDLAREYEASLSAPVKGFYTFSDSAHSPIFEESARTREILARDVLGGRADLADGERG
jgi:pimeloyl-ACP methyl ester carboxylesterase